MAENAELNAAVGKLNVATNKLRDGQVVMSAALDAASIRVFALTELIKTSMTPEEVATVKAALDSNTDILDAVVLGLDSSAVALGGLAASPVTPVPTPVPEPPVIPEA